MAGTDVGKTANDLKKAKDTADAEVQIATDNVKAIQDILDKAKAELTDAQNKLTALININMVISTPVSEEKLEIIAYAPAPTNMSDAQVELFYANGNGTGVYVNTDTSWKVFAKKTINGITYYRIGKQSQCVPAEYLVKQIK